MNKLTIQLVSNDEQTIFGTAKIPDTGFPGDPNALVWDGKVFLSAPQYGDGTPNYVEQLGTIFLKEGDVEKSQLEQAGKPNEAKT